MDALDRFDPALFGLWPQTPIYGSPALDGRAALDGAGQAGTALGTLLEIKSAQAVASEPSPAESLRLLLNEMTAEMRAQFATFRSMRASAERALSDGDEAAQKLARADVKAATDAMSLIVRTLEKIDGLQRQLARDREIEAERSADEGGYEEAKARFMQMIKDRAHDEALRLYAAWKRDGPPPGLVPASGRTSAEPADAAAGDGKECRDGDQAFETIR